MHPGHKKPCRLPPRVAALGRGAGRGQPKQDAAKQFQLLFCPDLLFCFALIGPPNWDCEPEMETHVISRLQSPPRREGSSLREHPLSFIPR